MSDNQDYFQYSSSKLQQMNYSYPWNGSIIDNSQSYFSHDFYYFIYDTNFITYSP